MPHPTDTPPTRVIELATNLDDITGEQVGHAIDRLIEAGALDAWATPITMKKGRPAVTLSVLVEEDERAATAAMILSLTGSFGVRYRIWDRIVLHRDWHERPTRLGSIKLKVGTLGHETFTVKPEYDDVVRLAEASGVSFAEAHRAAQGAADDLLAELRAGSEGGGA